MKPATALITFLVLSLVILAVFFGQTVFSALKSKAGFFLASFSSSSQSKECESLVRENERLEFELLKYEKEEGREVEKGQVADVFSRYPFNDKERLVVNLGESDIKVGLPVVTDGYLLGRVSAVERYRSEIQTIFDPEWKSSVAVGDAKTKAVMEGGQPPRLELIPKDAEVEEGEFVFNIFPDFPYEKLIGKIEGIEENPEKTWYTASVRVPYTLDEVTEVVILDESL